MGSLVNAFKQAEAEAGIADKADEARPLSDKFTEARREAEAQAAAEPQKPIATVQAANPPGRATSFGAGAGEAVGRGFMGAQQWLGKGVSAIGSMTDSDMAKHAGEWLQLDAQRGAANLSAENAPYQAAHPGYNLAGEVTGFVGSPLNKLVPAGGPAGNIASAAIKGATQGSLLNLLTNPVEEGKDFLTEKGKQAVVGAAGGAAGGAVGYALSGAINKGIEGVRSLINRFSVGDTAKAADTLVGQALASQGMTAAQVAKERPELFAALKDHVQEALRGGKTVDAESVARLTQAQTLPVPVPMLKGQVTRDPMQYAMEQNLRGIKGVGEPITQTIEDANRALKANLNAFGASKGTDVVTAGKPLIETLRKADKAVNDEVGAAYDAFKKSTGRALEVPLPSISGGYAKTLAEYGDAIPAVIRKKFEALGAERWDYRFTIEEAEGLIKSINKNYDPSNKVAARALNELSGSVQKAIAEGAGSSAEGTAAAGLASAARKAASQRFKLIESTPALKAAIQNENPDKFIQKYVLQGNEREISSMMRVLKTADPAAAESLANSVLAHIKSTVLGGRSEENAAFSEAALKQFVANPNMRARLTQVLGPERMAQLQQLHGVAENVLYAPVASAVNRSNTASAGANLVQSAAKGGTLNEILDIAKASPILSTPAQAVQKGVEARRLADVVNEAVSSPLGKRSAVTLADLINPAARAGAGAAAERSRREARP